MITSKGKTIVAKYLIGQAPAYASYIAVGCGAKPISLEDDLEDYSEKQSLDFEMFRVPIISRGYVSENNKERIVFTAELPAENRHEISEIGVYSAGSNPSAIGNDSRIIYSFSQGEQWEYHTASESVEVPVAFGYGPLDPVSNLGNIEYIGSPVFRTTPDNRIFSNPARLSRYESTRFLNETIAIAGNDANLIIKRNPISNVSGNGTVATYTVEDGHSFTANQKVDITGITPSVYNVTNGTVVSVTSTTFTVANTSTASYTSGGFVRDSNIVIGSTSNHIHLTGVDLDFSKNSPTDEIRFAFSIVSKNALSGPPQNARVILEFASSDDPTNSQFARLEVDIDNTSFTQGFAPIKADLLNNRYIVVAKELQSLYKTSGFTWNAVDVVKIYSSVRVDGQPSPDHFVFLDAVRLENISTIDPLYGLSGYSKVRTANGNTIVKTANTSNFIEFRFALGLDLGAVGGQS
jgi:hypothetical protein